MNVKVLFWLELFSHLTHVKTEEKSSKICIYTGNLSGASNSCRRLGSIPPPSRPTYQLRRIQVSYVQRLHCIVTSQNIHSLETLSVMKRDMSSNNRGVRNIIFPKLERFKSRTRMNSWRVSMSILSLHNLIQKYKPCLVHTK